MVHLKVNNILDSIQVMFSRIDELLCIYLKGYIML